MLTRAVGEIDGLAVAGDPQGPVLAVVADPEADQPIDPHRWATAVAEYGFTLQVQPRYEQTDGTILPPSTHLTITPVTASVLDDLVAALKHGADDARGLPRPRGHPTHSRGSAKPSVRGPSPSTTPSDFRRPPSRPHSSVPASTRTPIRRRLRVRSTCLP